MLCKIGDIEVWRILEINGPFADPAKLYPNADGDVGQIIEDLVPGQLDPESGKLVLPVQAYLLKTPHHNILVDACVGNDKTIPSNPGWHERSSGRFMAGLHAAGTRPDKVDYVLCTHLHVDHVGWNTRLEDGRWVPTFPNARYLFPKADEAIFGQTPSDSFTQSVLPVITAGQAELVEEGHKLGDSITLIPTPGHTPGHVCIRLSSRGAEALITGDALHSTAQCWHPEWHFLFDSDAEMAVTSRTSLLEQAAESGARVIGSHFKLPSIGRVHAVGDGFKWADDD